MCRQVDANQILVASHIIQHRNARTGRERRAQGQRPQVWARVALQEIPLVVRSRSRAVTVEKHISLSMKSKHFQSWGAVAASVPIPQ